MNRPELPYAAFAGCAVIWGSTFLAIRAGDDVFPAVWACTLRLAIASLALGLLVVATRQKWPRGDALKAALWYGFLEFGIGLPLLYWGEKVVNSGLAAVLYAISPIAAMFGARAFGMEQLNPQQVGSRLLLLCWGVAIIFWRQVVAGGSSAGLAAIGVAACAGSMAAVMLQRGPRQSSIGANAVGTLVALPISLIASFALGEKHNLPTTVGQMFPIFYLAIASSVVAFGLFAWLVNHWKVTTVAFLGVIVPVIAVIVGFLARGESYAPGALFGAAVVVISVAIAIRSEAQAKACSLT